MRTFFREFRQKAVAQPPVQAIQFLECVHEENAALGGGLEKSQRVVARIQGKRGPQRRQKSVGGRLDVAAVQPDCGRMAFVAGGNKGMKQGGFADATRPGNVEQAKGQRIGFDRRPKQPNFRVAPNLTLLTGGAQTRSDARWHGNPPRKRCRTEEYPARPAVRRRRPAYSGLLPV